MLSWEAGAAEERTLIVAVGKLSTTARVGQEPQKLPQLSKAPQPKDEQDLSGTHAIIIGGLTQKAIFLPRLELIGAASSLQP